MRSVLTLFTVAVAAVGCDYHVDWPDGPVETLNSPDGTSTKAFAIGSGGRPNYFQHVEHGRVTHLSFDDNADGTMDESVALAANPDFAHFAFIMDGVPFDLVQSMYDDGHFRLFATPIRVVSVFPSMTDLALSRIVRSKRCIAAQSLYFDRESNALSNGNGAYLKGINAPWRVKMHYCAPQNIGINAYLNPPFVFSTELRGMYEASKTAGLGVAFEYSVGSAGLGTCGGEEAMRSYMLEIEKLCERITYERRGRVKLSVLADHGHTLRQARRVTFTEPLKAAGFRIANSIQGPNDVVPVHYGIVTYAQFHTDRAGAVADVLVKQPSVDLVTFREADHVVVLKPNAVATIRKRDGGFQYDMSRGDPLKLSEIMDALRAAGHVSADGTIADRPLFSATVTHRYPDPLHRLWSCFDDLVDKPADVIASLKPEYCHGSKFFHFFVDPIASTHGGFEYESSVTFMLTNANCEPLPAACRVDDVLDLISQPSADRPAD